MNTKSIGILCVTAVVIGVLFWPTLYRYDTMTLVGNTLPVRMNRLTGNTEYFTMGQWLAQKDEEAEKKSTVLPLAEQAKVSGNAGLSGYGLFSGNIYNGSNWTITDMIILVLAKEKDGTVRWDRRFKTTAVIPPLSTRSIQFSVTGDDGVASTSWSIEEIHGYE